MAEQAQKSIRVEADMKLEEVSGLKVVAYGGGTDSTAMLIECVNRGIKIDLILFADTGGEKPHTYQYVEMFSKWLIKQGMPEIIMVKKGGIEESLEENCLRCNMLPSLAYGFKSCSQKFKIQPQDKFCNNWEPAKKQWKEGNKVYKLIGYDASEDRRATITSDKKYNYVYPLIEWDIDREECLQIIKMAGLPLPGKSACFFCPSSRPHEIRELKAKYPTLAERALKMEKNAELTSVKGLGRNWAWADLLATDDLFGDESFYCVDIDCGCYDG